MTNNWKYALLVAAMFPTAAAFAQSGNQGRRAVDLEHYQEAKSIYKSQLNSKEADNAYFALGDVYLRSENVDSAAYYFNQGLAKNSKSAINMVGLGKVELEKGNRPAAEKHFEDALKRDKKNPYVRSMIAEAYIESSEPTEQDLNKAIEHLKEAVSRDKNNAMAYVLMGDAYLKLNNGGQAMTSYDRATQLDDKFAKAHLRRGQLYTSSRNYNEAEESYKKVIALDPNYAPAYRDLGELYYFAGQYDRAVSTFKQYVDMAEKTPATRAKYASFLFLTKDYEGTLTEVQEVLKTDPNNKTMNRLLAYSYLELGKPEEALRAMENYLTKVDANSLIASDYEYYGKILGRNNQPAKAIQNLEKAIAMDPSKPELYESLSTQYAREKQFDKAIEVYTKKQEKLGVANTDYFHIGNVYMMAEQYAKADETYKKITDANPTYAYGHIWRARAQSNLDPETEKGLAKPHYEEFIKLAGNEKEKFKKELIEANTYLGYYYYIKGDRDDAVKHWTEVKTLDPTNTQAETALAEISKSKSAAPAKKRR
jgi:tetratricopeptide (TPR) repeat protein